MGGGLSAKNGFCFPSLERLGPGEFMYVYDPNATATIATITAAYTILRLDAAVGFKAAAAAAASRSFAWRMDMPAMGGDRDRGAESRHVDPDFYLIG